MKILITEDQFKLVKYMVLNEEYPYTDLKRNPSPELIAKVIKDSNGGWVRNDYEAWAEAAFSQIKDKNTHDKVAQLLGLEPNKRVLNYILGFMNQSEIKKKYHVKPIYDHEQYLIGDAPNKELSFNKITQLTIDNIEGGYYNPQLHYDSGMGKSGETLFGMDRKTGVEFVNSSRGKEFWNLVDQDRKKNPKKWVRYYKLDDNPGLKQRLVDIVSSQWLPNEYSKFSNTYIKDSETKKIINSDPKLKFHMAYACWNGSGFFKGFAEHLTNLVKKGIKDTNKLFNAAVQNRLSKGGTIAKSGNIIKNDIAPVIA